MLDEKITPSTFTDDADDSISGSIVFSVDQDRLLVTRAVYSSLDYLADIGGLFGTFNGFANTLSLILNFNGVYHLLTSSLFSVETQISKNKKPKGDETDLGEINKENAISKL